MQVDCTLLILNFSDSLDKNVHNVAVDGSFDDCQDFVKELFGDADIRGTHQLAAVNSINWARILAQMYVLCLLQTFEEPRSDSKRPFFSRAKLVLIHISTDPTTHFRLDDSSETEKSMQAPRFASQYLPATLATS